MSLNVTDPTTRKSHRTLWLAAAAAVVLLILAIRHYTGGALVVRTATVQRQDMVNTLATNGTVEPQDNFEAHSPMAGTVKAIYVREGDIVPSGKLLLAMDDNFARSQVASALAAVRTAQLQADTVKHGGTQEEQLQLSANIASAGAMRDQAAATLATLTKLEQSGAASPSEVLAAKNHLAIANANLQNLQLRKTQRYAPADQERVIADQANAQAAYQAALDTLQKENVRAPFHGTVYSIPVRASEYVQAGDTLLKMADLTRIQIRAYFDEPEIGKLAVGQPISIVWDAHPGQVWHGHIVRTPSTIIIYGTRHVGEAIVSVDDANGILLPNTNVTLTVTTMRLSNVLTIPREALHEDGQEDYVYQVVDERLVKTPIKIGQPNLTMVQVLSGLDEHATVALSAPDGTPLRNGLKIRSVQ